MGVITEALSLFPADTPASHSVLPGSAEAQKMTATSGRKCAELLAKQDRLGSLLKTCLGTSAWASTKCCMTWKPKATPRGRLLFRLVPQTPRTKGTASGFWPTPQARDHMPAHKPEYIAAKKAQGHGMANRNDVLGGVPNPTWLEWLMGYPPGWTAPE